MTQELPDAAVRREITGCLDRTLFVEAGAGSGKTQSLVDRVVAIVLSADQAVPLRHVAAVTFTEKAGAELRDRLRVAFESELGAAEPGSGHADRSAKALDDLDAAAIGTLHSFAERILGEHPIEAGLPPLIEVRDEVASGVAFDDRWTVLRTALLDDPWLAPALLLAMAAGMGLEDLRSMARAFTENWDLLQPRVLATPAPDLPVVEVEGLIIEARRLAGLREHCTNDEDKFLLRLDALAGWAARLETAADDPALIGFLAEAAALKWGYGSQANWARYGLRHLKDECAEVGARAAALRAGVVDAALRRLADRIAAATLEAARERRAEGQLEFHDLLVLARDLLRSPVHGAAVRTSLQQRYRWLLLGGLLSFLLTFPRWRSFASCSGHQR